VVYFPAKQKFIKIIKIKNKNICYYDFIKTKKTPNTEGQHGRVG
jgi:hypothetical protein